MSSGRRGRFITFEGVEGAGKTTIIDAVRGHLETQQVQVEQSREPGGTELAEALRQVLLQSWAEGMPAETELLLMFAARAAHLEHRIRPALEQGRWVLCDRFVDASRAYQGAGRGLDGAWIDTLSARVVGDTLPDRVIILDVPVAIGLERARSRGETNRFDDESLEFMERVRDAYLSLARGTPERYAVIDATQTPEHVAGAVFNELQDLL